MEVGRGVSVNALVSRGQGDLVVDSSHGEPVQRFHSHQDPSSAVLKSPSRTAGKAFKVILFVRLMEKACRTFPTCQQHSQKRGASAKISYADFFFY